MVCFPGDYLNGTAKGDFDDQSVHLTVRTGEQIAAYLRLTPGPKSYFEAIHRKRGSFPTGPDVIDSNRAMVAPTFRGQGVFEWIMLEGLLLAANLGFRQVVDASTPSRGFRALLHKLGFVDCGPPVTAYLPNGETVTGLPVVARTHSNRELWDSCKLDVLSRLHERGFDPRYEIKESRLYNVSLQQIPPAAAPPCLALLRSAGCSADSFSLGYREKRHASHTPP
jgi:hypothetical protein